MKNNYADFLCETFLFKNLEQDIANKLIGQISIEERKYLKGDTIYSPENFEEKVGFVLDGKCRISRHTSTGPVPLNLLKRGDSFAITTIFSTRDMFPTIATAATNSAVIFITKNDILYLISQSVQIAVNIMNFLTERIEFLNDKIAAFSSGTVGEKLVNYILTLVKKHGTNEFEFNKKRSAEALNCGRASLYRAMDSLAMSGYVTFADKKIYILDLKGLERISK